jgi:metal transporter CNNM
MANEALPVFLSALLPEWLSVLVSVTLVLLFGEILPSAFFTGKAQLHTAAIMIPFVKGLTVFFWPIGYPLSKALDYFFGVEEETSLISREELGALVYLQNADRTKRGKDSTDKINIESRHQNINSNSDIKKVSSNNSITSLNSDENENNDGLSLYEINIMTGILKLSKLQVKDSMIKIKNVFMISDSTRLDSGTLESLWNSGFSRIPVFKRRDKQHIVGYLLIKSLILVSFIFSFFLFFSFFCGFFLLFL